MCLFVGMFVGVGVCVCVWVWVGVGGCVGVFVCMGVCSCSCVCLCACLCLCLTCLARVAIPILVVPAMQLVTDAKASGPEHAFVLQVALKLLAAYVVHVPAALAKVEQFITINRVIEFIKQYVFAMQCVGG